MSLQIFADTFFVTTCLVTAEVVEPKTVLCFTGDIFITGKGLEVLDVVADESTALVGVTGKCLEVLDVDADESKAVVGVTSIFDG